MIGYFSGGRAAGTLDACKDFEGCGVTSVHGRIPSHGQWSQPAAETALLVACESPSHPSLSCMDLLIEAGRALDPSARNSCSTSVNGTRLVAGYWSWVASGAELTNIRMTRDVLKRHRPEVITDIQWHTDPQAGATLLKAMKGDTQRLKRM